MPFIGKSPQVGAFQLIDSITTSATDTYALTVSGSAYVPESARNLIVSLNGVTQAPESAYTVSGSNIVFASALTASDVIDYILVIGDAVDIGTPSDNTVGDAQLKPSLNLSSKTLTFANDQISGDVINGGTISSFASTGIDDNATSTAITIDSSENVGIGTASPSELLHLKTEGTQLLIEDTSSGNKGSLFAANTATVISSDPDNAVASSNLQFQVDGSEAMRIDSSGNVGIGTTSPNALVEVQENVTDTYSASASSAPNVHLQISNEDTTTANTMSLVGFGSRGTTTTTSQWYIGNVGMNNAYADSSFVFGHRTAGSTWSEVMRLDGSGALGIGTTNPTYKLVVSNNGEEGLEIDPVSDDQTIRSFYYDRSTSAYIINKSFADQHVWTAGGSSEKMRLNGSGNLGIGTTTPAEKLTVVGEILTGAAASTSGQVILKSEYLSSSNDFLNILGTQRSNSAWVIGYGVKPSPTTSGVFLSTADNSNFKRGALLINDELIFMNAASQQTAVDSTVTLTERMRIDASGNVGIGTTSPRQRLTFGSLTATATATPECIDLGGTYSNSAGSNLKLKLYEDGSITHGFGVSNASTDYVTSVTGTHKFFQSTNERMRIDASGNLLVGTTSDLSTASDSGVMIQNSSSGTVGRITIGSTYAGSSTAISFRNSSSGSTSVVGSIVSGATTTSYNTSSDVRLKENIVDAPAGNIDAIRVRSFDWKADGSHQTYGMVAQELVDVAPEAVSQGETEDDVWGVDYSKLVPMMIKEIQDLKAEVAALKGA